MYAFGMTDFTNTPTANPALTKPHLVCLVAQSRDGFIAKDSTHRSETWVSDEDKTHFHAKLNKCDWIIAGRNTAEQYANTMRPYNCLVFTQHPENKVAEHFAHIDPEVDDPIAYLAAHGAKRVAVLGGTRVYDYCLENNLLDEVWLTIEPTDFYSGLPAFNKAHLLEEHLSLKAHEDLNNKGTELLYYKKDYA